MAKQEKAFEGIKAIKDHMDRLAGDQRISCKYLGEDKVLDDEDIIEAFNFHWKIGGKNKTVQFSIYEVRKAADRGQYLSREIARKLAPLLK